jgi:Endoribonuclease L-PSP
MPSLPTVWCLCRDRYQCGRAAAPPKSSAARCKNRPDNQTILKAAGGSLDRVVKVTVFLARPDLYKEMNEAYAEFFPKTKPARAMARFGADIPGVLVAIEAIALA